MSPWWQQEGWLDTAGNWHAPQFEGSRRLWVPSEDVSWHRVDLAQAGRQWRHALPYALEEMLAQPIESVHLVVAEREADGGVWVAVTAAERLREWQRAMPSMVGKAWVPDVLALPEPALGEGIRICTGGRCWLRWGKWQGSAGAEDAMSVLAHRLSEQQGLVWRTPAISSLVALPPTQVPVNLAPLMAGGRGWDQWGRWRWPLMLSGLALGLWLIQIGVSGWQWQQQTQALMQVQEQAFVQSFPHIQRRVNLLAQARSEVKARTQAVSARDQGLLAVLQAVQKGTAGWPAVQTLQWQGGTLVLGWEQPVQAAPATPPLPAPWKAQWKSDRVLEVRP